ncbi:MAG: hypothetical protein SGPRY_013721, partial [Prymnesium sp.]
GPQQWIPFVEAVARPPSTTTIYLFQILSVMYKIVCLQRVTVVQDAGLHFSHPLVAVLVAVLLVAVLLVQLLVAVQLGLAAELSQRCSADLDDLCWYAEYPSQMEAE